MKYLVLLTSLLTAGTSYAGRGLSIPFDSNGNIIVTNGSLPNVGDYNGNVFHLPSSSEAPFSAFAGIAAGPDAMQILRSQQRAQYERLKVVLSNLGAFLEKLKNESYDLNAKFLGAYKEGNEEAMGRYLEALRQAAENTKDTINLQYFNLNNPLIHSIDTNQNLVREWYDQAERKVHWYKADRDTERCQQDAHAVKERIKQRYEALDKDMKAHPVSCRFDQAMTNTANQIRYAMNGNDRFTQPKRDAVGIALGDSEQSRELARKIEEKGGSKSLINAIMFHSRFVLDSTYEFAMGVAKGTSDSFHTTTQALQAIYENPKLLNQFSQNLVWALSQDPLVIPKYMMRSLQEHGYMMIHGNAYQRGQALVRVGQDALQAIAFIAPAQYVAETLVWSSHITRSQAAKAEAFGSSVYSNLVKTQREPVYVEAQQSIQQMKTYHRLETPSHTREVTQKMKENGQLWGKTPRSGHLPTAQAYEGPLPAGAKGVEFVTAVVPASNGVPGGVVNWYGDAQGVILENEWAKIPAIVTKENH